MPNISDLINELREENPKFKKIDDRYLKVKHIVDMNQCHVITHNKLDDMELFELIDFVIDEMEKTNEK